MTGYVASSTQCWKDRNEFVHGARELENIAKQRWNIEEEVKEIYRNPPMVAARFPLILAIPIDFRLKLPLRHLQIWVGQV